MTDLPCPAAETGDPHRLASRRSSCAVCNRSGQAATRRARATLAQEHPETYAELFGVELARELERRTAAAS